MLELCKKVDKAGFSYELRKIYGDSSLVVNIQDYYDVVFYSGEDGWLEYEFNELDPYNNNINILFNGTVKADEAMDLLRAVKYFAKSQIDRES